MSETWFILQSPAGRPAENMAVDEALLEYADRIGHPVLRFYRWTEPAATFGYFQKYAEVAQLTLLRPLIRRPTGGGVVPHDADWTYSLVFPPDHPWYQLKAVESYRLVHDWFRLAFEKVRVATELSETAQRTGPGQCFAGAEKFDLLFKGRKLAGAAQRRNRNGLLIQGSIQPQSLGIQRTIWLNAMLESVPWREKIGWKTLALGISSELDEELCRRSENLVVERYSQDAYNQRR